MDENTSALITTTILLYEIHGIFPETRFMLLQKVNHLSREATRPAGATEGGKDANVSTSTITSRSHGPAHQENKLVDSPARTQVQN